MRLWRLILWGGLGSLVLALVSVVGAYLAMAARFNPAPPKAAVAVTGSPLVRQREDLAQFGKLLDLDRSFSPAARRQAKADLLHLDSRPDVLPAPQLQMALSRIAALADNGHTSVYPDHGGRPNLVPVRVFDFADGLHVVRARPAESDLLGAEVLAIGGRPITAATAALTAYHGGPANLRRQWAVGALTSPALLYGAGLSGDPARTVWTLRLEDGRLVQRVLEGEPVREGDPDPAALRWLSPSSLGPNWKTLLPSQGRLPLTLLEADNPFRLSWVDGGCVMFLQFKANQSVKGHSIAAFQRQARQALKARRACGVIVDLRFDSGGDYTTTASLARDLPSLIAPGGKIAVLTGVSTFSAGITTTAFLKQAGGARVLIVGEPVGDRLNFWSEGGRGCLPHGKVCLRYTTARHRYDGPCDDWRRCYWLNWLYPVRVANLEPDRTVGWRFTDYRASRDPAFDQAMALVTP